MGVVHSIEHYRFGSFELHPRQRQLLKDAAPISLRPRAFDLLVALVEHAGQLVTKGELLDRVWPNTVVEEAALHVQVSALRKVLGSDAITTVSGRGYQFTLSVISGDRESNRTSKVRHNLPYQLTSFIGREQEMGQLEELVTTNRLVTLTGAGGAGKTRLAIEVAARLLDAFPDGVWMVEFAALADPRLVPHAVAQALALKERPGKSLSEIVSEWLESKRVLLILDNVEHAIDECARLLAEILRHGPNVAILATSRERLGMSGELTYRVPSLTVPGTNGPLTPETVAPYEGVRLFLDRAKLLLPDFDVTIGNAAAIASVCARLDGMPLAIELAAPRLRTLSLDELSDRLDQRFALLTEGSRAAPARHRTLRSMLDWSYDLLTEQEQSLLRRVAVFAGGWTLASAEQVCAGDGIDACEVVERLTSLVDKSLVMTDEHAGATRYRMLATVRQYAQDRLQDSGEGTQWRNAHLACFVALGAEFNKQVMGTQQQAWLGRITGEHDNLRAALTWSTEASPLEGLQLAVALDAFWRIRGLVAEGRAWYARLLEVVPVDPQTRLRARGLYAAALFAILQGDYAAGKELLQESLVVFREIDDARNVAYALDSLAYLAIEQGEYPEAEARAREAVDLLQARESREGLCFSLIHLAIAVHRRGDWTEAHAVYERSLLLAREFGTPWEIGTALREIGLAECDEGRFDLASSHFAEATTILHGLGDRPGVIESLEGLAGVAAATEAPLRAARLWGAAHALQQEMSGARSTHQKIIYERQVQPARAILSAEAFDRAWNEGRGMSLDDTVRYALDERAGRES